MTPPFSNGSRCPCGSCASAQSPSPAIAFMIPQGVSVHVVKDSGSGDQRLPPGITKDQMDTLRKRVNSAGGELLRGGGGKKKSFDAVVCLVLIDLSSASGAATTTSKRDVLLRGRFGPATGAVVKDGSLDTTQLHAEPLTLAAALEKYPNQRPLNILAMVVSTVPCAACSAKIAKFIASNTITIKQIRFGWSNGAPTLPPSFLSPSAART